MISVRDQLRAFVQAVGPDRALQALLEANGGLPAAPKLGPNLMIEFVGRANGKNIWRTMPGTYERVLS